MCKNCETELLKLCKHCNSVNFPVATKCRKCGTILPSVISKNSTAGITLKSPSKKQFTASECFEHLLNYIESDNKKFISISGSKGSGKSSLLSRVIKDTEQNIQWCVGRCSSYTQITAGGVLQDMLLNLFNLPKYYSNISDLKKDALKFFSDEFKFLNSDEILRFINFLYNYQDGNYEDILLNKKYTYNVLFKVFEAFIKSGNFVFVIDNFDFIDGFSLEFFTNLIHHKPLLANLKLLVVYNNPRPVINYFGVEGLDLDAYADINISPLCFEESESLLNIEGYSDTSLLEKDKYLISEICGSNPAFMEQAVFYCFDCQIANRTFSLSNNFHGLIKERLDILQTSYPDAFKALCAMCVLGEKFDISLIKRVYNYDSEEFEEIISYLCESRFIKKYNESYYEFLNQYLWETILANLSECRDFDESNVRVAKAISSYSLNTDAIMTAISHNLKEHRMSFDIWTKISRLSAYIGDVNLYVVSQRQCLALLNEFNESETLNIRYNISERLGKILTEYDQESAMEFLPDAIANAKTSGDDVKEIELLGYLAHCCKKMGNYYGDIECVDNTVKRLPQGGYEIDIALLKSTKLTSLMCIGNCGEVINLIDNDVLPKLEGYLMNPRLDRTIPLSFIYETKMKTMLCLAQALVMQGNNRAFEVLSNISSILKKDKISDDEFICKVKLTLAFANTIKGDYKKSYELMQDIVSEYGEFFDSLDVDNSNKCEIINSYLMLEIVNKLLLKDYQNIQHELFEAVSFANDTGAIFSKHILKIMLGKMFYDKHQAKHAMDIYNEEISFFAKEKLAIGALLTWYFIAQATLIIDSPQKALDIANQALEIAQNPRIHNYFFVVLIKTLIAKIYIELADYESAKMNIETAISLAQKYEMNDLLAKLYLLFGKYYQDLSSVENQNCSQYLKMASSMFVKSLNLVTNITNNQYLKDQIEKHKGNITFC